MLAPVKLGFYIALDAILVVRAGAHGRAAHGERSAAAARPLPSSPCRVTHRRGLLRAIPKDQPPLHPHRCHRRLGRRAAARPALTCACTCTPCRSRALRTGYAYRPPAKRTHDLGRRAAYPVYAYQPRVPACRCTTDGGTRTAHRTSMSSCTARCARRPCLSMSRQAMSTASKAASGRRCR